MMMSYRYRDVKKLNSLYCELFYDLFSIGNIYVKGITNVS